MKQALALRAQQLFRGDIVIWTILFALVMASVLAVYSSTGLLAYKLHGGNTESLLLRHLLFLGLGGGLLYLAYWTPHKRFSALAPWLLVLSVALLLLTAAFGIEINNARRWLEVPLIGVRFQPSDIAKIALVLYLARALSVMQDRMHESRKVFTNVVAPVLLVCGLIAPSDLSTALMLGLTCFGLMFIARLPLKWIAAFVGGAALLAVLLFMIWTLFPEAVRFDTWSTRITEFATGDGGYQVNQAKIAIANGEFFGQGAGYSTQRNFLPTPYADFIYAIICEEYGLVGASAILGAFLLLFLRTCRLLTRSSKLFGALLACGLSLLLVSQALANIAVSVNVVPVTGLTLPLVSLGGTSLVFSCLAMGMILSVSRATEAQAERKKQSRKATGGTQTEAAL